MAGTIFVHVCCVCVEVGILFVTRFVAMIMKLERTKYVLLGENSVVSVGIFIRS